MTKITDNLKKNLREFGLTSLAVDNATSIFLLTFMIFLFGVRSYNSMPKESFPEIPFPQVFINTVYFGNSAADMENLVSRHIEKELATITELKNVTSTSMQDFSIIVAEFNADVNISDATRKVKDAVDRAKPELPTDLTKEPEVLEINLSEIPIMTVNLSGQFTNDQLRNYAEYLQDEIEDLREISKVSIKGALEREVSIEVDLAKMQALQISFGDIENAVKSENMTMSGGELLTNEYRRTIRIIGEFTSIDELRNLIVKAENQLPVQLKDIAEVTYGFKEVSSIARANQQPVISLDVIKRSGENLLDASDKIKLVVEKAKAEIFPKELEVTIFNDQSVQTRNMVSNLENSIISGVILVVLVLLFFLGIRNAMFVGIAIPLSMLLGILLLSLMGYTLNMVVLFSLILALGMLVDNAIVVVENIYRYMQNGYSSIDAARYGASEVAMPIIASTATTLAAFVPLAFWPGLIGSFMSFLPITLIAVLSASLFVALVINPVLTARFMKVDKLADDPAVRRRKKRNVLLGTAGMVLFSVIFHFLGVQWLRNILWFASIISVLNIFVLRPSAFYFQNRVLPILEQLYDRFIARALRGRMPVFILAGTFLLLIVAIFLMGLRAPKVTLFPEPEPAFVNAFVELPVGKDIEATNTLMRQLEKRVTEIVAPNAQVVDAILSQIGENTGDPNAGPDFGASPHKARLTVSFVPSEERNGVSTTQIMEDIREGLRGYPGVRIVVDQNQAGPPTGKPVNIEVQGDDINTLALLSERMVNYINQQNIGGIEELKKDVDIGKPELLIHIDREAARRYGISSFLIADAIRTSVFGKEISKYKDGEDDHPIQLRVNQASRYNIDDLLNQRITFRSPSNGRISQVPISSVAEIEYSSTYTSIKRKNQKRVITISSNVLDGYNPNEVVAAIRTSLERFDLPEGFSYSFTGEQEEQAENLEFLSSAFLVALFAIFIIIVAQFNSIISPFIILITVLFSTIGVFLGYVVNGMDVQIVMTGVGIISLAGIVVNNAIVLIDYINLLLRRKMKELDKESLFELETHEVLLCLEEAGATRLRPVLLTAITTVLGLVPLAIGFNFNFFTLVSDLDPNYYTGGDSAAFWGTMAWTVIYGLVFATFLTLIVVPVMFWLAYRSQRRLVRWLKRN
jgi:multidrug efflux pump